MRSLDVSVISVIKERKTSYDFTSKKVGKKHLDLILEAGKWAPSSHNSQNWSFIVVRDRDKIASLIDACYYGYFHSNPPVIVAIVMEPIYLTRKMLLRGDLKRYADTHKFMNISLPAYSMCLEAQSLGIQSFIASVLSSKVNKLLNVPKGRDVILIIGLGYEKKNAVSANHLRSPLNRIVFEENYGDVYEG